MPSIDRRDISWRRSSYSAANGNCVEVTRLASGHVAVRDSKNADAPVLRFTPAEWRTFLGEINYGRRGGLAYEILKSDEMTARLCRIIITTVLSFAPVASVILVAMYRAPTGLKYGLECGSTLIVWAGVWILQYRRSGKRIRKRSQNREP